ncbi:MAG: hypothetical protein WAL47_09600 [Pyrinomonadaceae bacterium]
MPYTTMHDKAGTVRSPDADVRLDHPRRSDPGPHPAEGSKRSSRPAAFARDEAAAGRAGVA